MWINSKIQFVGIKHSWKHWCFAQDFVGCVIDGFEVIPASEALSVGLAQHRHQEIVVVLLHFGILCSLFV